jgi:phosphatidylserine decarboxylase
MKLIWRLMAVLAILFILMLGYYRFWFLRQTERKIPYNESVFVSPANGKIVCVKPWREDTVIVPKEELGIVKVWAKDVDTAGTIISIQMDLTNVHYQRAPMSGKVLAEKWVHGNFNNAVLMSNEYGIRFENERNEFLLQNTSGQKYKVIQIAGFLARRIIDYVHAGETIKQGQVIGLIKLGSQVTVILPHDVKIDVHEGDKVIDGETGLAETK